MQKLINDELGMMRRFEKPLRKSGSPILRDGGCSGRGHEQAFHSVKGVRVTPHADADRELLFAEARRTGGHEH